MLERWSGTPVRSGTVDAPPAALERWKLPLTAVCLVAAMIGAGLWIGGRPVSQPIVVPTPAAAERAARTAKVHVAGAVARPGLYELSDGQRVADAIAMAGGALEGADLGRVNLALKVRDQQQILVPLTGQAAPTTVRAASTAAPSTATRVNLNQAGPAELEKLPGVGKVTAERIARHRTERGPFGSLEDFQRARLVSSATWEKIKEMVEAP